VVAVGEIVGAHALRGWLRVRAYQPPAPSLVPGRRVLIEHAGACRELEVVSATPHGRGLVLLTLAGVDDRRAAEALVGARVLVRAADLPPPAEDEFYYHEVVGFRVETTVLPSDLMSAVRRPFASTAAIAASTLSASAPMSKE